MSKTIRRTFGAATITGLTAGALLGLTGTAGAHDKTIDAGCTQAASYLSVKLVNYNADGTNTVRVRIDGITQADTTFATTYTFVRDTLTPDEPHTYEVDVDAHDGTEWDVHTGVQTIEACYDEPEPTASPSPSPTQTTPSPSPTVTTPAPVPTQTTPVPTPTVTTPAPLPLADLEASATCTRLTVHAPNPGSEVVASISDQDRTVRLVDGRGTLTFPPHNRPLTVIVTVTAPGRAAYELVVTVPVCEHATVPSAQPTPTTTTPAPTAPPTIVPKPNPPVRTTAAPKPVTSSTTSPAPAVYRPVARDGGLPNTGTSPLWALVAGSLLVIVGGALAGAAAVRRTR